MLKLSNEWAECSEIMIYQIEPKQVKICFSTLARGNRKAETTFPNNLFYVEPTLSKRIIVNAANKEIRIWIDDKKELQIVGTKWRASII